MLNTLKWLALHELEDELELLHNLLQIPECYLPSQVTGFKKMCLVHTSTFSTLYTS